jgi:hypothetical protein
MHRPSLHSPPDRGIQSGCRQERGKGRIRNESTNRVYKQGIQTGYTNRVYKQGIEGLAFVTHSLNPSCSAGSRIPPATM